MLVQAMPRVSWDEWLEVCSTIRLSTYLATKFFLLDIDWYTIPFVYDDESDRVLL